MFSIDSSYFKPLYLKATGLAIALNREIGREITELVLFVFSWILGLSQRKRVKDCEKATIIQGYLHACKICT